MDQTGLNDYTYSYVIYNPTGDVVLPGGAVPPGTPEFVDTFSLDFDASVAGAVLTGPTGGDAAYDYGFFGLKWSLYPDVVEAGDYSGALSFTSALPPSPGNAVASDSNPPSPWSSSPFGQAVPIPGTGNFTVPDSADTLMLLAGALLLFPLVSALKSKPGSLS